MPAGRRIAVPVLVVLAACGADRASPAPAAATAASSTTASATPAAPTTSTPSPVVVHMDDFTFTLPATVAEGQEIVVVNDGNVPHTFTDLGGAFDVDLKSGRSATIVAPAPGRYEVVCRFHANSMFTTLVVE